MALMSNTCLQRKLKLHSFELFLFAQKLLESSENLIVNQHTKQSSFSYFSNESDLLTRRNTYYYFGSNCSMSSTVQGNTDYVIHAILV